MNLTTMSQKGQIVIPKKIRDSLGIKASDTLKIHSENGKIVASPLTTTDEMFGMFKVKKPIKNSDIKNAYKNAAIAKLAKK